MFRFNGSIRFQLIVVVLAALLVLAVGLEYLDFRQQQAVQVEAERQSSIAVIRSLQNSINTAQLFINTLSDIPNVSERLTQLTAINENIEFVALVVPDGEVLFHSNAAIVGQVQPAYAAASLDETKLTTVPVYGTVYLTAQRFSSDVLQDAPSYLIVVGSDDEPIQNNIENSVITSAALTAVWSIFGASMIILFLQFTIITPLEKLTDVAQQIEDGDYSVRADVQSGNEIGRLAGTFNSMTQRLTELINNLEARVQERTEELEIARDRAENASRAKSDFLSNMSHELRTPLNMVIGYTSSMLTMPHLYDGEELPEVYRQDLELIRQSGKHLLSLINDVLDLSKVEAGKLSLNFAPVSLGPMFAGVLATAAGLIGNKPIQLRQVYPDLLPPVWGDAVRIRQILLNLMSNAIKYTDSGSVLLRASLERRRVRIDVVDSGPGLSAESLDIIFDRFEQIQSNNADVQGTGLGLDISQRLAKMHGTEITIETELGHGSTFSFVLPVADAAQRQLQSLKDDTKNVELFHTKADIDATVLVVAAASPNRQALRVELEQLGVIVIETHEAREINNLATGLLPDLVYIDATDQALDVLGAVRSLRDDLETRDIPLVVYEGVKFASVRLHSVRDARLSGTHSAADIAASIHAKLKRVLPSG